MSNIIYSEHLQKDVNDLISQLAPTKIAVVVDENTREHCLPLLQGVAYDCLIETPSGEVNKTLATCSLIWDSLTDHAFDRKGLVINLGGGVIGDMSGFCAKTYKRGLRFLNIPTTLLAQVDASIGGKLGIDYQGYKNHIGLFSEPEAVIIHSPFLNTLPAEEIRSGFAEIIKHHLIADAAGWKKLKATAYAEIDWTELIRHSVAIKQKIVNEDPYESGLRKILNFGHSLGHAIETYLLGGDNHLLHGEAVAAGMLAESYISFKRNLLTKAHYDEIEQFIRGHYDFPQLKDKEMNTIISLMKNDKKNKDGNVKAVLIKAPGTVIWDQKLLASEVRESLSLIY